MPGELGSSAFGFYLVSSQFSATVRGVRLVLEPTGPLEVDLAGVAKLFLLFST